MRINSGRRFDAPVGKAAARRHLTAAAMLISGLALASPAFAEKPTLSSEVRANLSSRVDVKIVGRIDSRCLLSGGGEINFGELRGGEGAKANFGLDCNVPFNIDVHSAQGGLAHVTQPMGEGPFAGTLEYDLRVTVPTLRPTPAIAQANFSSRQLLAARTLSSGDGISAGGGVLEFRMRQAPGAGLLAGQYGETVTLTVTPQM